MMTTLPPDVELGKLYWLRTILMGGKHRVMLYDNPVSEVRAGTLHTKEAIANETYLVFLESSYTKRIWTFKVLLPDGYVGYGKLQLPTNIYLERMIV